MVSENPSMYPNNGFVSHQEAAWGQGPSRFHESHGDIPHQEAFWGQDSNNDANQFSYNAGFMPRHESTWGQNSLGGSSELPCDNEFSGLFSDQQVSPFSLSSPYSLGQGLLLGVNPYSDGNSNGAGNSDSSNSNSMMMFMMIALLLSGELGSNNNSNNAGNNACNNNNNNGNGSCNNSSGSTGSTENTGTNTTPATTTTQPSKVWGDPHFINQAGQATTLDVPVGDDIELVTGDNASIMGQAAPYNSGKNPTVFGTVVVNEGDGTEVRLNRNGTADEVDSNGNVTQVLKNGQTVTSADGNSVTYNATNKSLKYTFAGQEGDISGSIYDTPSALGNYINTSVTKVTGSFGGALPELLPDLKGAKVNKTTGAGAFQDNQTLANFTVDNLYS